MVTAEAQAELKIGLANADWDALQLLLRKLEQDHSSSGKHLLVKISNWFLAMELLRDFEDKTFYLGEPSERDKEFHRAFLTQLTAWGEALLLALRRQNHVDVASIGMKFEDVEACLKYLRDCYSRWYTDISDDKKELVLKECFGEE